MKQIVARFKEVCDDLCIATSYDQSQEMGLNFYYHLELSFFTKMYMIWRVDCRSAKQSMMLDCYKSKDEILNSINNLS